MINIQTYITYFACAACLIAGGYVVNAGIQNNLEAKTRAVALINMPAYAPPILVSTKEVKTQSMHGLFGALDVNPIKTKKRNITPIKFGPKSLEGVFIQDGLAWAIVTDQKNQPQLIHPENITAFTASSITFESQKGIKSLHITQNDLGIDIRKFRIQQNVQSHGIKRPTLSRAEKIRKAMLERAKKKSN